MKLKNKILALVTFVTFALLSTSQLYAADSAVFNMSTGSESVNVVKFSASESIKTTIENDADIENDVSLDANTGCNEANSNTGDGLVETGSITADFVVESILNQTEVSVPREGSTSLLNLEIENNNTGANSSNIAKANFKIDNKVEIENDLDVDNKVDLDANTGGNEANSNTGDGRVSTGNISLAVMLETIGNTVKVVIEGCCPGEDGEDGEGGGVSPGDGEFDGVSPGIGGGELIFADSLGIGGGTLPVAGADEMLLMLILTAIGTILIVQILDRAEKAKLVGETK